ncbi:PREDICTED: uncharacterized protein LOC104587087 [Nelumbo nucifera]|uniref:Uncharacterized protein LOC104587087 n=2 Tax=Nelumbo nucifera TaxID=4432 RepID=A0A1U7YRM0_NELNU|nr:PREDICTED: uncharacterized protein LOC104587087 [Nelumbo nucifera]DAD46601.1 TPA_asm: hypothetical protein HUJ06_016538 [Nelumbo nucifera]
MLRHNFEALRSLHDSANDLLQSPVTQQALVHHRDEKWIHEVTEGSLRMLDVCSITRDVLLLVKEHLQDLHSTLRRRSAREPDLDDKIGAYNFCRKKMKKEMIKCLQALKKMNKCGSLPLSEMDQNLVAVVGILRQVRVTTISIVESILSFMSRSNRNSFIPRCLRARRVGSAVVEENEVERVNTALCALHGNTWRDEKTDAIGVQTANKRLEALELAIEDLEFELECMFRRLIRTRVSLLNILSN